MKWIRRNNMGFTLIETLVALAIAGIVINGFYSALSTGSLLDQRAALQAQKVFVAVNVLDRVGVDIPLRSGNVQTGSLRDLDWELMVSANPTPDMQLGPTYTNELIFVSVSVVDPSDEEAPPVVIRAIRYNEHPL